MASRGDRQGVWAAVAVGGIIGTGLRLGVDRMVPAPWALIIVNALGAALLLILVLRVWPTRANARAWLRDGVGAGVLGSFTTLSAVSLAAVGGSTMGGSVEASPAFGASGGLGVALAAAVLAGAIGTLMRYALSRATRRLRFPLGVLVANVLGSLSAGIAMGLALRGDLGPEAAMVIIAGWGGGLTTFSTVIADTVGAWLAGHRVRGSLIVVANLALGAGAAWLGLAAT